jgi:tetratricopeptide (TPR) repeat protein
MRALILICVLWPLVGFTAPRTDANATYNTVLNRAHAAFKAKQPAQALRHLDEALTLSAQPDHQARVQFFRARCLINLHRPDEARAAVERFITGANSAEDKRRGRAWLAKIQRRFYGSVRVICTDGAVRVALKDAPGQPHPCPAQWDGLRPGKHRLTFTGVAPKPNGHPGAKTLQVELRAGEVLTHNLDNNAQHTTAQPEPSQRQFGWGLTAHAGAALARGTVATGVDLQPGLAVDAGLYAELLWPMDAVRLGPRMGLSYRHWSMGRDTEAASATVRTHSLSVPLLAHLSLPSGLSLNLGPALELMGAATEGDHALEHHPIGLSALAELGWHLPWLQERLSVSLRYQFAVSGVFERVDLRRDAATLGLNWAL